MNEILKKCTQMEVYHTYTSDEGPRSSQSLKCQELGVKKVSVDSTHSRDQNSRKKKSFRFRDWSLLSQGSVNLGKATLFRRCPVSKTKIPSTATEYYQLRSEGNHIGEELKAENASNSYFSSEVPDMIKDGLREEGVSLPQATQRTGNNR